MDWQTIRKTAKEKVGNVCRVCPVCNGVACAGEVPGVGGLGTGAGFRNNIQALAQYKLNMRTIHASSEPCLETDVLGMKLAMPVIGAAIGGIAINYNGAVREEEYALAVLEGCNQAGTAAMTGDGPKQEIFAAGIHALNKAGGLGIPIIKPRSVEAIIEKANQAAAAGAAAFGIDIDAAALVNMTRAGQPVGPKTQQELAEIKKHTSIPFIVKGIMAVEDAEACCAAGVDALVISNHGGRALDHTPGTAEVLPYIAEMSKGRLAVLADGGIRGGADILKMLALGADAVLVGRPLAIGAIGGGSEGAAFVLRRLASELRDAMVLTGCENIGAISEDVLW